jgi:methylated-DNA-[protein]-cysteine S-methyltransferase
LARITVNSPVGPLSITCENGAIVGLSFNKVPGTGLYHTDRDNPYPQQDLLLLDLVSDQLEEYFSGKLRRFSLPILLLGTDFQRQVWQKISEIPYGCTYTYTQIATAIGSPTARRAVGRACAANPIAIVVPCHRVVGTNSLGGYGGGLPAKKWLLTLERIGSPPP